jgi:hypothetical protein
MEIQPFSILQIVKAISFGNLTFAAFFPKLTHLRTVGGDDCIWLKLLTVASTTSFKGTS